MRKRRSCFKMEPTILMASPYRRPKGVRVRVLMRSSAVERCGRVDPDPRRAGASVGSAVRRPESTSRFLFRRRARSSLRLYEKRALFVTHTWVTLYETTAGFLLAVVFGIVAAAIIVVIPRLRDVVMPLC